MPRKQHKYHYLYKTTNVINGKFYYGMHSTSDLNDGYLGSGKRLRYSISKYGKENFTIEILAFFESRNDLVEGEKRLIIEETLKDQDCMNIMQGGEGGFISEEQQRHRSHCGAIARKEKFKNDPEFAEVYSKKMSLLMADKHTAGKIKYDTFTGKTHTDATKQKMSAAGKNRVGSNNSQFGTCWICHPTLKPQKIKVDELDAYLNLGWYKGRKYPPSLWSA